MQPNITYPRLIRRVQAILIDYVIFVIYLVAVAFLFSHTNIENSVFKIIALTLPIVFEPLLVSMTGGTIGHHCLHLRVRSKKHDKNINIFAATIRFILKVLLGWFSLIIVLTSKHHQAIHDFLSRSIIVNRNIENIPSHEALRARENDPNFQYPSKTRRVIVIAAYLIIATLMLSLSTVFLVLGLSCIKNGSCEFVELMLGLVFNVLFLFTIAAIIIYGWRGKLYGCRKKPIASTQ